MVAYIMRNKGEDLCRGEEGALAFLKGDLRAFHPNFTSRPFFGDPFSVITLVLSISTLRR